MQFFGAAAKACGAHDHAHIGRDVEAVQGFAQFIALFTLDASGNAAGTRVVRHQHQIAASEADEGGQGCALVAAFFLVDLDDDFLAFFQNVFDVDATFNLFGEVFAGDFLEREKAVSFGAEVDKGGFQAGFDAGDTAFVDVGLFLLASAGFDIQIVEALTIYQGDTQLFGLSCVNEHSFHEVPLCFRCFPVYTGTAPATLWFGVRCVSVIGTRPRCRVHIARLWRQFNLLQLLHTEKLLLDPRQNGSGGRGSGWLPEGALGCQRIVCGGLRAIQPSHLARLPGILGEESAGLGTGTRCLASVYARHIILKLCIST